MKALLVKFLQSKAAGTLVLTRHADGSLLVEERDATGGSTAATAPASDVATLVAALAAA
jgi:hypothetical protein